MVKTRSMLKTDTKTATEITMVQSRSMSKTNTKTATDTKKVERASKQTRKKARKNADYCSKPRSRLIDYNGLCVFMLDYMKRHPVPNITPTDTVDPFDAMDFAGQAEWRQMSASEKAPFIKTAMESMGITMVQNRSMSKLIPRKLREQASKQGKRLERMLITVQNPGPDY
ncbi:hypothetical protein POM88_009033 [Heracleum sosnowskyi]|uniref:Uncharacterized protein n=1 Tax=Heracleum sosnowskyi TaxID=360622 RepID=A0AAD8J7B7_9APIA|nr:hypothetical protein POM88_009033 [Heracleum sosnowskyi]